MKKFLIALLGVGLSFTMVACGDDDKDTGKDESGDVTLSEDEQAVATAKTRVTYTEGKITKGFSLFLTATGGVNISYVSSNSDVLTVDGASAKITRPEAGQPDVDVKLTATFTKGSATDTKEFNFTVVAFEEGESGDVLSVINIRNAEKGAAVIAKGVVSAIVYGDGQVQVGFYITDDTGSIYVNEKSIAPDVKVGDELTVSGVKGSYDVEIRNATLVDTHGSNATVSLDSVQTGKTFAWMYENDATVLGSNLFEFELTEIEKDAKYGDYYLKDGSGQSMRLYSSGSDKSEFAFLDDYIESGATIKVIVTIQKSEAGKTPRGQIVKVIAE